MILGALQHKKTALKIFQFIWIISFLPVFSTALIVTGDLANGVISGKYFWFLGAMGLLSLFTLLFCVIQKISFQFSFQDFLICLFAISVYTSSILFNNISINTTRIVLFTLLIILYFYFRLVYHANIKYIFLSFCIFLIVTGFIEAIWGLCQLYGWLGSYHSHFQITGSFFNPGPYAGYLAIVFPVSLYIFIAKKESLFVGTKIFKTIKIFAGISCILMLLILPASMSRAAWVAVLVSISILLFYYYKKNTRILFSSKYRKYTVIFFAFCSILIYGLYILKKDSVDGRFLIWKVSVQMLTEHTLGVGLGNFPGAYGNAQALYLESHTADKFIAENTKYAFNEYLQILVESGIISFLLFGIIIFSALRNMFRANDFSIFTSLISLLLFALFSYPFSVLPFLIVIMFLLGSSKGSQQISTDSSKSNKTLFFPLFFFFLVVCCTINRYPVYRAYQKWHDNKELFGINNYNETVTAYEALYPYLSDQVDYLFEYAQSLSNSKQFFTSNLVLERAIQISCDPVFYIIMGKNYQALKQYDKSEQCFLKASQIVPNRIYPHYLLAKLYVEMNLTDKVKKTALVVIHQCPKIQSIMVKEMKKEMEQLIKITE